MAPRERRYRRGQKVEPSRNDVSSIDLPVQQTPISRGEEAEERNSSPHGISILKEIFPDHGSSEGFVPSQQMLLNSIPTPSRASTPPMHALTSTTPLSSPLLSPPTVMPIPSCHSGISYRERLRAGGRGAFQRGFDIGLMPKSMRQDWVARQNVAMTAHPISQNTTPISSPMSYSSVTDSHAMWNATAPMPSADYWPSQMEFPPIERLPFQQDQFQQDQFQQDWRLMAMQQPELQPQPVSHGQVVMDGVSMQLQQMQVQVPQMHLQQMEPMPVVDSSPAALHRCMAIIMPETAQFPCDKNVVAAQLQAAADCQCYED